MSAASRAKYSSWRAFVALWIYARSLYLNTDATLEDLREAVTTLEDTERIARRVLGGAHPLVGAIGRSLQNTRFVLSAREAGEDVAS